MTQIRTIMVSSAAEALAEAQALFRQGAEWVIAEGAATVGGAMFEANFGTALLHRSGRYTSVVGSGDADLDRAKARILAALEEAQ